MAIHASGCRSDRLGERIPFAQTRNYVQRLSKILVSIRFVFGETEAVRRALAKAQAKL